MVRKVVADVRTGGDRALIDHTERFDQVRLCQENLRVREDEIEAAYRRADPNFLEILNAAAGNIRRFHESHPETSWFVEDGDGVSLGKRSVPIDRVAILIPGASAPLFSTLLMGAIPAQVAGVRRLCVATPPQRDGSVHPAVLAAARVLGLSEIYRVFGAQAVAALAYGTETIPKVDKIVGPGHPAVQIAKKIVFGTVGVDMVAGPSEIVVLADESADPRHVAADLLAQAEHGSGLEAAICITPSQDLAQKVAEEVERQLSDLARRDAIQKALDTFGAIVVVKDSSPKDSSKEAAPKKATAEKAAPKKAAARKAAPAKDSSAKDSPREVAPKKATAEKAAPEKASTEKGAPKKTAPKKAAPKKAAPKKAAPKKVAPKKAAPKKAAPAEDDPEGDSASNSKE